MELRGRVCTEQPTTWRPVCLPPQHSPTMDLTETSGTRHIIEGLRDKGTGRRLVCAQQRGVGGGGGLILSSVHKVVISLLLTVIR